MKTFSDAIKDAKIKAKKAIEECCLIIEADAKLDCVVDTGNLKGSITHDVKQESNKTVGTIGTNVDYAYIVDRRKPYLTSSIDKNREAVKRKIAEVLSNAS